MSVLGFFGRGRNTLGVARSLFFNCKHQSELPVWFSRGKIGQDFRSKQTMLMIHIWMIHRRLLQEGSAGNALQECMFDELWDDTSIRIRNAGIAEISVNKRLSEVQGYSFRTCMELDHCMTLPSEDEKLEEIAGVMWRSAYLRNNDIMPDHVIEMASHVQKEHYSLLDIPSKAVMEGRVEFGDVKHLWGNDKTSAKKMVGGRYVNDASSSTIDSSATASASNDVDSSGEDDEEDMWLTNLTAQGKPYYYNKRTRETRWTLPENSESYN